MRITLGLLNFFRTSSTWTPTFFPINVFLEKTWLTKQFLKRKKEDIPLMKKSIREIPERWQHSERREWQIRSERKLRCRCQRRCRRRCWRRRKPKRSEAGTEKCQSGKCLRPEKIKKRVICNFFIPLSIFSSADRSILSKAVWKLFHPILFWTRSKILFSFLISWLNKSLTLSSLTNNRR